MPVWEHTCGPLRVEFLYLVRMYTTYLLDHGLREELLTHDRPESLRELISTKGHPEVCVIWALTFGFMRLQNVFPIVVGSTLIASKRPSTIIINKRNLLNAKVSSLVVLHVSFGPKALAASLRTREGSLARMDEHVDS